MSNIIELKNVNKWFDKFQVLKEINLEVKPKEKIVVCGPSGSGKSTLIRCINRLEEHQEGSIIVDSHEISENTKNIENIRAEVGMVFQQ
jgi:general L-amino acid transport system ATP-binding protein